MFKTAIRAAILIFAATALHAAQPAVELPAATKWVLTLDLQSARQSPLMQTLAGSIPQAQRDEAAAKLASFKVLSGIDLTNDIQRLTLAGGCGTGTNTAAYIHGTFDIPRLTTILGGADHFTRESYAGVELLSWKDKDSAKYISFARPGLAVMAQTPEPIKAALDTLAGKAPALSAGSALAKTLVADGKSFLSLNATDVADLTAGNPQAAVLQQAQKLAFTLGAATPDALTAALTVETSSAETAQQLRQMLLGLQAVMQLQAAQDPDKAALANAIAISGADATVALSTALPKDLLTRLLANTSFNFNVTDKED